MAKATKVLDSVWGEVDVVSITTKVPLLFPMDDPTMVSQTAEFVEEDFTTEEVSEALRSFPKGSSGGLGGLMADHLVGEGHMFAQALTALATLASAFA